MKKLFLLFALALSAQILAQPVINGTIDAAEGYTQLSNKLNTNLGFGPNIDVTGIYFKADGVNNMLYLGVTGKLDTGNDNAMGVWINVAGTGSPTGAASNTSLGFTGAGNYMDGDNGANIDFKADFEVDYMFAFNPGGAITNVYFDASKKVGGSFPEYQGTTDQAGTPAFNDIAGGIVFAPNTIQWSFRNTGLANTGLEMKIPFAQIGATSSMSIQVYAFIVSSTGFFSDVTVPGNVTGGNPGFNPNFSTLAGGQYHSANGALPVELTSFSAVPNGSGVVLNWETSSETNNRGFEVERNSNGTWSVVGFVQGNGTTTAPQNYTYSDNGISNGGYIYRLKQLDFNGNYTYSNEIEIDFEAAPDQFNLAQNYPNPFNPSTRISYSVAERGNVSIVVYDMLGNVVRRLVNNVHETGSYDVTFDAEGLTSGIYLYKMETGGFISAKKLMLIK